MKNYITKLVDLPMDTAKGLTLLASQNGNQKTKPFIEQILIDYEKQVNHPRSANYKSLHPKPKK